MITMIFRAAPLQRRKHEPRDPVRHRAKPFMKTNGPWFDGFILYCFFVNSWRHLIAFLDFKYLSCWVKQQWLRSKASLLRFYIDVLYYASIEWVVCMLAPQGEVTQAEFEAEWLFKFNHEHGSIYYSYVWQVNRESLVQELLSSLVLAVRWCLTDFGVCYCAHCFFQRYCVWAFYRVLDYFRFGVHRPNSGTELDCTVAV